MSANGGSPFDAASPGAPVPSLPSRRLPSQPLAPSSGSATERREVYGTPRPHRADPPDPCSRNGRAESRSTVGATTRVPVPSKRRWPIRSPPSTPVHATPRRRRPATEVSLTRVGVTGVEKVIHVGDGDGAGSSSSPSSTASSTSTPSRPASTCPASRRSSTRRSTSVVLGETPARRGARRPHRRARARAPGRPARRGHDRRPLPGDRPHPGLGPPHPGDLHPVRHRRRLRARHPHPDRRRGPGHDRLPLRPGPGRPTAPASASPPTASPTTRSSAIFEPRPRRHPQPARHRLAPHRPPRGPDARHRRPRPAAHRRAVDELARSTS